MRPGFRSTLPRFPLKCGVILMYLCCLPLDSFLSSGGAQVSSCLKGIHWRSIFIVLASLPFAVPANDIGIPLVGHHLRGSLPPCWRVSYRDRICCAHARQTLVSQILYCCGPCARIYCDHVVAVCNFEAQVLGLRVPCVYYVGRSRLFARLVDCFVYSFSFSPSPGLVAVHL